MELQCCLNGAREPGDHPALPVTPVQIGAAVAAVAARVSSVHVHPKDADGVDSMTPAAVAAAVMACREAAPRVPVGVTTGAWSLPAAAARVAAIEAWTVLPDMASVNWHEDGAERVAAALLARGVAIEAGVWHAEGLAAWEHSAFRDRCLRVLVEVQDMTEQQSLEQAAALVSGVRRASPAVEILLHGEERSTWPVLREAQRRGLATRIGLEDVLTLPGGEPAADNAALVAAALS